MNGTVVNCLVKCKVHRPLKITDRSNQSMEKTKDKRGCWIESTDLL